MSADSIKGSVIVAVTDDLQRLLDEGRLRRETLEARLEPEDLETLDAKIQAALWYPIASYDRLLRALLDAEGPPDEEAWLRGRGRRSAERLRAAGIYAQLGRPQGAPPGLDERRIRLTLSLWKALITFARWEVTAEAESPPTFRIDVEDAAAFPRVLRVANAGFLEGVFGGLAERRVAVSIADERADRFAYRIRVEEGGAPA